MVYQELNMVARYVARCLPPLKKNLIAVPHTFKMH